jgi:eukaryotic-like serine/threonine-protein kinase
MTRNEPPSPTPFGESRPDNFLDSWKQIAAYLERDVRTVQRWEKKEGLPVHRQIHEKLGTVYAYKSEIDAWWRERRAKLSSSPESGEKAGGPRIVAWPGTAEIPDEEPDATSQPRRARRLAVYSVMIAGLIAVVFGLYELLHIRIWPYIDKRPLEGIQITRLPITGQIKAAAISPDGKYVAYVRQNGKEQSLRLHQVATGSDVQTTPPAKSILDGLTFTPDGNYLYYMYSDGKDSSGAFDLYRVPPLGGISRKVISGVDTPVTFSPDGTRLAVVRYSGQLDEDVLTVTNIDGSGERKLAARKNLRGFIFQAPAWDPTGKWIAAGVNDEGVGVRTRVAFFSSESGQEATSVSRHWSTVLRLAWLPSGRGLVFSASESPNPPNPQIWRLDWPSGEVHRITNDTSRYLALTLTGDGKMLEAVQSQWTASLWLLSTGDSAHARQITSGSGNAEGADGLAWTPDGKIVYTFNNFSQESLRVVSQDGGESKDLALGSGMKRRPAVCANGNYIVYASLTADSRNIWRVDPDGTDPKQLTFGKNEGYPQCTLDSKWVLYGSSGNGPGARPMLVKVSIDGGVPIPVSDKYRSLDRLSPDGHWIAGCFYGPHNRFVMGVIPAEGGDLRYSIDPPSEIDWNAGISWTPDGRELIYSMIKRNVSNLWAQPLLGGPPHRLTSFDADLIFWFDWSHDGKNLALSRGSFSNAVVLIRNFK